MQKITEIYIEDDFIKLGSLLKYIGIASTGGQAKQLILEKNVNLNGEVCTQRGKKIKNGDKLKIFDNYYEVIKSDN